MNDFERKSETEEELEAEYKEFVSLVFEPREHNWKEGTHTPSPELIAEYYAELEAMEAAHVLPPEDDILIAA